MNEVRRMEHERRQRILERIATLDTLPSLPKVVSDMLRLLSDANYNIDELMTLVQQDPALTARLLKLANSAIYGRPRQIDSLHEAMVLLGAKEIHRLVTTISVMRSFDDAFTRGRILDKEQFWAHSVGTGELAVRVSAHFGLDFRGVDFTAGLLHDVGKVVLDQHFHAEFRDCLDLAHRRGLPQFEAETRLLGLDHADVGQRLAARWGLPDSLSAAISQHHAFEAAHPHAALVACVRLANHLVKDEELSCLGEDSLWELELDPAWFLLCNLKPMLDEEAKRELLAAMRRDFKGSKERVRGMVNELTS